MRRWAILLMSAAMVAGAPAASAPPAPSKPRPNIVLIVADDLGYGDVGAYGQRRFGTPNIDALARCGMRFTQAYAGSPVCAPSRAALLTGRDTGRGQIRGNDERGDFTDAGERGQMPLAAGTPTIASALREAGYRTAVVGKWGLGGPGSSGVPEKQGFDYAFGYLDQKQAHNYFPTHLWENGRRVPLANPWFMPHAADAGTSERADDYRRYIGSDYAPDRLIAKATGFIADNARRPFFLLYTPNLPHAALQVPEADLARFKGRWPETPLNGGGYTPTPYPRATRAAMIARLDREVGDIVAKVRGSGLAARTLILFTSDNGPSAEGGADIAFFKAAGGLRGQKRDVYEGGIRVPLIACWPGHISGARTSNAVTANWDLPATLAAIAGARAPAGDGVSIAPALFGRKQPPRAPLYWEFHEPPKAAQAVRDGRWKAVRFQPRGFDPTAPVELYDLTADPGETRNLAARYPAVAARLAAVMNARKPSSYPGFNFDKK